MRHSIFIFALLLFHLTPQAAHAEWVRAESDHFIGYGDGNESLLRADIMRLERFDAAARIVIGLPASKPGAKLKVYFMDGVKAVRKLHPVSGTSVDGFYNAPLSGAYAVVARNAGGGPQNVSNDRVMYHEYAHHLMYQYFPASYPDWYVEGFAEFLSDAHINEDGSAKLGLANQARARTLLEDAGLPIEEILSSQVHQLPARNVNNFYGRSWALVHMLLLQDTRKDQLTQYLNAINNGAPSLQAARAAFGDLSILQKDLNGQINARKLPSLTLSKPQTADVEIAITRLSNGDGAAVIPQFLLSRGVSASAASKLRAQLRALAQTYPASGAVYTALAESELDHKNLAAARDAADIALKIDPLNSRALLWKGLSYTRALLAAKSKDATAWRAARAFIVRANRANPNDPLPLFENFQSYRDEGVTPTESAVKGLEGAQILLPQNAIFRIFLAVALADRKQFDEAIAVLLPVANNTHADSYTAFGQKLIAAIQRAKASGSLAEVDGMERVFSRRGS